MSHLYSDAWIRLKMSVPFYQLCKKDVYLQEEKWIPEAKHLNTKAVIRYRGSLQAQVHKYPTQKHYHYSAKVLAVPAQTVILSGLPRWHEADTHACHTPQLSAAHTFWKYLRQKWSLQWSLHKIATSKCSSESAISGKQNAFEKATASSCASPRWILHLTTIIFPLQE